MQAGGRGAYHGGHDVVLANDGELQTVLAKDGLELPPEDPLEAWLLRKDQRRARAPRVELHDDSKVVGRVPYKADHFWKLLVPVQRVRCLHQRRLRRVARHPRHAAPPTLPSVVSLESPIMRPESRVFKHET